jgi:hypothetical protein
MHQFLDNKLIISGTGVTFYATDFKSEESLSHKFMQPNLSRKAKHFQNTNVLNMVKPPAEAALLPQIH